MIDGIGDTAGTSLGADVCDRARDGRFGAWPRFGPQHPQMPCCLVPFENEARMRTGACRESRVTAQVFLRHVQALCGGVYAGSTEPIPQFSECKKKPERDI